MKLIIVLLIAAMAHGTSAQAVCNDFWTRGLATVAGGKNFTGIQTRAEIQDYNNPLYFSEADAKAATAAPAGRFTGIMSVANGIGIFGFEFFKTKSWMSIVFGRGVNEIAPDVITGGTGCYSKAQGTATRVTVPDVTPPMFKWTICLEPQKKCGLLLCRPAATCAWGTA